MKHNFSADTLEIDISRSSDNGIVIAITSDYSRSQRKSQLYVNEKALAEDVERFWKGIKTKKLLKMSVSFDEIDWYDDMTDMYDTPVIHIQRGLKKARIVYEDHGSIPKEWGFSLVAKIADTTTKTAIVEIIKRAIGSYYNPAMEKKMKKGLTSFLQKKIKSTTVSNYMD